MAETTRNHIFSKEISQVIIAAMVLAPNFYGKNCLRVISAMRGNPPLGIIQLQISNQRYFTKALAPGKTQIKSPIPEHRQACKSSKVPREVNLILALQLGEVQCDHV